MIHVAPDRADLVETRIIDGRKCLVIPMESEVELNGIRVSALNPTTDKTDEVSSESNSEEEIPF